MTSAQDDMCSRFEGRLEKIEKGLFAVHEAVCGPVNGHGKGLNHRVLDLEELIAEKLSVIHDAVCGSPDGAKKGLMHRVTQIEDDHRREETNSVWWKQSVATASLALFAGLIGSGLTYAAGKAAEDQQPVRAVLSSPQPKSWATVTIPTTTPDGGARELDGHCCSQSGSSYRWGSNYNRLESNYIHLSGTSSAKSR